MEREPEPKTSGPYLKDSELEALKDILFRGDKEEIFRKLDELQLTLQETRSPEFFGDQLPEAFAQQISKNNESLKSSIAPLIGSSIQIQIKNEKEKIVDALYPVIGSTIAKYLSETLQDLMENINAQVDEKFSVGGFKRKLKSKFSGVSEAELIFQASIQPKIKSIFLIHKKMGVAIASAHAKSDNDTDGGDEQMVAGMLTAITSFVNNWIQKDGEVKEVDSINYGDSKIFFESSGSLVAAVVVRSDYKKSLCLSIRKFLELIHSDFHEPIENFNGDLGSLPDNIQAELTSLIGISSADAGSEVKSSHFLKKVVISALCIGALLFLAYSGFQFYETQKLQKFASKVFGEDPFLKDLKLTVAAKKSDLLAVSGIIPNSDYLKRVQMLAATYKDDLRIDDSSLVIIKREKSFGTRDLSAAQAEDLRRLRATGGSYSSIVDKVSPAGVLTFEGFSEKPLVLESSVLGAFFTGLEDKTQRLSFFVDNAIGFPKGRSQVSAAEQGKLLSVLKKFQSQSVVKASVYFYEDGRGASQESLTARRIEALRNFMVLQGPRLELDFKPMNPTLFSEAQRASLKRGRKFVFLPVVDRSAKTL